jgi:hypothetical protein
VSGIGMGCTFAPLTTLAMRDVDQRLAGAASGVLNTVRQVGTVIGTAAVGALLQNRLVAAWSSQAAQRTRGLPGSVRGQLVSGFRNAAKSGLQVGAGQTGTKLRLPAGSSPGLIQRIEQISRDVFSFGFVSAMRWTMAMPVVLLLVAALCCLAIKRMKRAADPAPAEPAEAATPA